MPKFFLVLSFIIVTVCPKLSEAETVTKTFRDPRLIDIEALAKIYGIWTPALVKEADGLDLSPQELQSLEQLRMRSTPRTNEICKDAEEQIVHEVGSTKFQASSKSITVFFLGATAARAKSKSNFLNALVSSASGVHAPQLIVPCLKVYRGVGEIKSSRYMQLIAFEFMPTQRAAGVSLKKITLKSDSYENEIFHGFHRDELVDLFNVLNVQGATFTPGRIDFFFIRRNPTVSFEVPRPSVTQKLLSSLGSVSLE